MKARAVGFKVNTGLFVRSVQSIIYQKDEPRY